METEGQALKGRMVGCCRKPGGENAGLNWSGGRRGESRWFQELCRQQGEHGSVAEWTWRMKEKEAIRVDNLVSLTEKSEAIQFEFPQLPISFLKFYPHSPQSFLLSYNYEEVSLLFRTSLSISSRLHGDLTQLIMLYLIHVSSFSLYTPSSCEHTQSLQSPLPPLTR